jgi:hypothetical protein
MTLRVKVEAGSPVPSRSHDLSLLQVAVQQNTQSRRDEGNHDRFEVHAPLELIQLTNALHQQQQHDEVERHR